MRETAEMAGPSFKVLGKVALVVGTAFATAFLLSSALFGAAWTIDRGTAMVSAAIDPFFCVSDRCTDLQEARQVRKWCEQYHDLCLAMALNAQPSEIRNSAGAQELLNTVAPDLKVLRDPGDERLAREAWLRKVLKN
jgi:hypothetical protein